MKKPYQIEAQRAVKQLETMAADDGNPAAQMVLPMAEMVGLREGVGELIRQAGLRLLELMQEEARELTGERRQRQGQDSQPVGAASAATASRN